MFRDKWRESPTFEFLEKSLRHGSDSTGLTGSDSDSEYKISNSRSSFPSNYLILSKYIS